ADLSNLMPKDFFKAHGAAEGTATEDRAMVRDVAISLVEANGMFWNQNEKVSPIMVDATQKPQEAVSFHYDYLVEICVWVLNTVFSRERKECSIENALENGDNQADKKNDDEQVVAVKIGEEALKVAGGPTKIGSCGD